jgi:hypothetical protein
MDIERDLTTKRRAGHEKLVWEQKEWISKKASYEQEHRHEETVREQKELCFKGRLFRGT